MTADLTAMIRAARKEAHRLSHRSREQERELAQVIVKLQEAEMWCRAREEQQTGSSSGTRPALPAQRPARRARALSSVSSEPPRATRWVLPELG